MNEDEYRRLDAPLPPMLLAAWTERRRQIAVEGYTFDHDDQHVDGELARAAATYAGMAAERLNVAAVLNLWPFDVRGLKPTTKKRDIVKAVALLLAEWDRLDRLDRDRVENDEVAADEYDRKLAGRGED